MDRRQREERRGERTDRGTDEQMDGDMGRRRTEIWADGGTEIWADGGTEIWADGRTEMWADGGTENRRMEGRGTE